MSQSKMHQVQNYRDGASTTTTTYSDVTCASGYHSYFGRDMQDYTADKGGGANHRRLSVLM